MASTSVSSFNLDKENDVGGSQLSVRTPHNIKNGVRLPSGSNFEEPLKPGQRSLSSSTPNLNRAALQNVKNTPMKGVPHQSGGSTFKTPVVVRPKFKQSPAVGDIDPMSRSQSTLPQEDEDFVGEFVAPAERVTSYLDVFIKCNPLALWGFPCIPFTGSTSDEEEDENSYLVSTNRRLDEAVQVQQLLGEEHMSLTENPIESFLVPDKDEDILPTENDERKLS